MRVPYPRAVWRVAHPIFRDDGFVLLLTYRSHTTLWVPHSAFFWQSALVKHDVITFVEFAKTTK